VETFPSKGFVLRVLGHPHVGEALIAAAAGLPKNTKCSFAWSRRRYDAQRHARPSYQPWTCQSPPRLARAPRRAGYSFEAQERNNSAHPVSTRFFFPDTCPAGGGPCVRSAPTAATTPRSSSCPATSSVHRGPPRLYSLSIVHAPDLLSLLPLFLPATARMAPPDPSRLRGWGSVETPSTVPARWTSVAYLSWRRRYASRTEASR